jgi:hypothetical protein
MASWNAEHTTAARDRSPTATAAGCALHRREVAGLMDDSLDPEVGMDHGLT